LALKTQLLAVKPEVVVATRPAGADASAELYREVLAWLATYAPDVELRVERQTIRRLRGTGAVVFTIHNYVASVNELRTTSEFIEHLLLGIDGAPAAMQEYKGWVGVAQRLREVLA
jgi:hypothetical protein